MNLTKFEIYKIKRQKARTYHMTCITPIVLDIDTLPIYLAKGDTVPF